MDSRIIEAHAYSKNNYSSLKRDKSCGCFHCIRVFDASEINEWIPDASETAICPYCGVDSVIGESAGYPIDKDFLEIMNRYWFK